MIALLHKFSHSFAFKIHSPNYELDSHKFSIFFKIDLAINKALFKFRKNYHWKIRISKLT